MLDRKPGKISPPRESLTTLPIGTLGPSRTLYGRRFEEAPGGDRCAEINLGCAWSRTSRSETGT